MGQIKNIKLHIVTDIKIRVYKRKMEDNTNAQLQSEEASTSNGSKRKLTFEDIEGYVENVFAFEVQGEEESQRVVCFSPHKRQLIDEKLKSPVKLRQVKRGTRDIIFQEKSTIEDAD